MGTFILLGIIIGFILFLKNRNWNSNSYIKEPKWRKFEKEVAQCFEQNGREVKLGPGYDDNGKDIVIRKGLEVYLVQCKHWYGNRFVTPKEIRDFQGAIDLYIKQYGIQARGIFITTGKTTKKARDAAKELWIELRDKYTRENKISNF